MAKFFTILVLSLMTIGQVFAQSLKYRQAVQTKLKEYAKAEGLQAATWSFGLWDVQTGEVVATIRPNVLMTPASTLKAFTTAAMLDRYGPDYRYATKLVRYPDCIALVGCGDPSLGSEYQDVAGATIIKGWAQKVADANPSQEKPYLIADLDAFEQNLPDSYTWGDMGNYYGAGPRAINWEDNTTKLEFKIGQLGDLATLKSVSPKPYNEVDWRSSVTYAKPGSGDNAYVYGLSHDKVRVLNGTIPAGGKSGFVIKAAMPEPELVVLSQLQRALEDRQVKTEPNVYTTSVWSRSYKPVPVGAKPTKVLDTYLSPPLSELVAKTNQESLNLFADAFLLKLGMPKEATIQNSPATIKNGLDALTSFAGAMGVDKSHFFVQDGSGLSPANCITAQAFGTFLLAVTKRKWFRDFDASLAVAGRSGTMKDQCLGTAATGNLHVKTGSLTRVQNFVGYYTGKDKRTYAVVLMVNRYTITYGAMRRLSTKLLSDLTEITN